jgi:hypothetical protein
MSPINIETRNIMFQGPAVTGSSYPHEMAKLVSLFDEKRELTLSPNTTSEKKHDSGIKWQSFAIKENRPVVIIKTRSMAGLQNIRKPSG